MKKIISLFSLMITITAAAQTGSRTGITDTVKQGYYIPLDSNVISTVIMILPFKGPAIEYSLNGNQLPADILIRITSLGKGSKVFYSQITALEKGVMVKYPVRAYCIGSVNTTPEAIPLKKEKAAEGG